VFGVTKKHCSSNVVSKSKGPRVVFPNSRTPQIFFIYTHALRRSLPSLYTAVCSLVMLMVMIMVMMMIVSFL
jgi:hypothetical protein